MIALLQRILPVSKFSAFCAVALLAAAGAALPLTGCQTASGFPQPAANWQTFQGQLRYSSGTTGKSVIGDVVIRRSPLGDFQLEFQSGPGFPLMRLYRSGDQVRTEGVLARGSWQGAAEKAPKPLLGWASLPTAFAGHQHKRLDVTLAGDHFVFQFGN